VDIYEIEIDSSFKKELDIDKKFIIDLKNYRGWFS